MKRVWKKLKQEAAQITKELEKKKPTVVELRQAGVPTQVWVRRPNSDQGTNVNLVETKKEQVWVRRPNSDQGTSVNLLETKKENKKQVSDKTQSELWNEVWNEVAARVTKLSLELAKLAQAVPTLERLLEIEGLKTAYEINQTGLRDDRAPVITVECKIRKHWKPVEIAMLDHRSRGEHYV